MNILLTGATGYIGSRLLTTLLDQGHHVTCCVRNINKFQRPLNHKGQLDIIEIDFANDNFSTSIHKKIDVAYYLMHSMTKSTVGYIKTEEKIAHNFVKFAEMLACKQVIYLGGIVNEEKLSEHLQSRKMVEKILQTGKFATTILRAGIIVGSGSASFKIISDLIEKLPIMITPKWVNTRCQPIAVKNVLEYLTGVLGNSKSYNQTFDIGGPDILTYKQMMLDFASVRKLKRWIYTIPVMSPRLSSYWLYFITSTNYTLAVNLVKSMKVEVVCKDDKLQQILNLDLISYKEAVHQASS